VIEYFHGRLALEALAAFLCGVLSTLGAIFARRAFRNRKK
jgi:hypothetical protein